MNRCEKSACIAVAIGFCILFAINLCHDLAHPETWEEDWQRDSRIWCPMLLGVIVSLLGLSRYAMSEARNLREQRR
jgi:hypothetical protein